MALVIGNSNYIAHSVKAGAGTLASLIVNNFGEATGTQLGVLLAAGLVLMVIGVGVNIVGPHARPQDGRAHGGSVAVA